VSRAAVVGVAFVMAVAGPTACARPRGAPREITVCTSLPLSGSARELGEQMQRGYERAVAEVNRMGGLRWRGSGGALLVALQVRDDQGHAAQVEAATEAFVAGGCDLLLGTASPVRMAVQVAVAERLHRPLFLDVHDSPGFPSSRARWSVPVTAGGDREARAHAVASTALRVLRAARRTDAGVLRDTARQLVPGSAD
jgi:ABC-type branched-subunit amino acid transport system substrate-binding protein